VSERLHAIELIEEARGAGARLVPTCKVIGISKRTFERWSRPFGQQDWRKMTERAVANKLTPEERKQVLDTANYRRFQDLPPCKIVPTLADEGKYVASESTCYRVLKEENQLVHRGKTKPAKNHRPRECVAHGPCQVCVGLVEKQEIGSYQIRLR
jgi:putative transposase